MYKICSVQSYHLLCLISTPSVSSFSIPLHSAVHGHSQGSPRLVDNLMTDALTLGAQLGKKVIDTDVILASVSSQNLG